MKQKGLVDHLLPIDRPLRGEGWGLDIVFYKENDTFGVIFPLVRFTTQRVSSLCRKDCTPNLYSTTPSAYPHFIPPITRWGNSQHSTHNTQHATHRLPCGIFNSFSRSKRADFRLNCSCKSRFLAISRLSLEFLNCWKSTAPRL